MNNYRHHLSHWNWQDLKIFLPQIFPLINPYLPEFLTPKNSENMQPHSNNYWKCNPIAVNQVKIYNLIKRHIPITSKYPFAAEEWLASNFSLRYPHISSAKEVRNEKISIRRHRVDSGFTEQSVGGTGVQIAFCCEILLTDRRINDVTSNSILLFGRRRTSRFHDAIWNDIQRSPQREKKWSP